MDVAKLKYEIDSRQTKTAAKDLDKMDKSATKADKSATKLGRSSKRTNGLFLRTILQLQKIAKIKKTK